MRRVLVLTSPLAVILLLAIWRESGPPPVAATAPSQSFSAARAFDTLHRILPDNTPHPIASPANHAVRDRVIAEFRRLGYETAVQRRFACNPRAACGMVENVIARHPNPRTGRSVVLAAHYDSVGAGPGAADDGAGVAAVLEIARAVRGESFRNPIVFLVDDGEEAGLLGAEAFLADPGLSRDVVAIVNVENRGTWGASNMFETSSGNRWLIRHLAAALPTPHASSLFYEIYKLLPNDTDVSVFKREGRAAVNFAAIRGVGAYHTPFDNAGNLSLRTLQHHGDNALATLRALARADLEARSSSDATYFDLLGFTLVWWPQEWTVVMIAASLALLVLGVRREAPRELTFGVLACFAALILATLLGFGLNWLTRLRTEGVTWVAHPFPTVLAMWAGGITAAALAAAAVRRRTSARGVIFGTAIVWHFIAAALAFTVPGAAFLFFVPALVVSISGILRSGESAVASAAAAGTAIVWFPIALVLYDALGAPVAGLLAVIAAVVVTPVAPFISRSGTWVSAGLALVATLVAIAVPAWTAEAPRTISVTLLDDSAAAGPVWAASRLSAPMRQIVPFVRASADLTPWSASRLWVAPAPVPSARRVLLSAVRDGSRVTVRATSPGAARIVLMMKGARNLVTVNGAGIPSRLSRRPTALLNGWSYSSAAGVGEMVAVVEAEGPLEIIASDTRYGIPEAGIRLMAARDSTPAVPVQDGDVTITRTRGRF